MKAALIKLFEKLAKSHPGRSNRKILQEVAYCLKATTHHVTNPI